MSAVRLGRQIVRMAGGARLLDTGEQALPELVAAACQVGGLGGVARQLDGFVVGQMALAEMYLSAGGLRRCVIRQAEVGACGRLLVRRGPDVKVATAG